MPSHEQSGRLSDTQQKQYGDQPRAGQETRSAPVAEQPIDQAIAESLGLPAKPDLAKLEVEELAQDAKDGKPGAFERAAKLLNRIRTLSPRQQSQIGWTIAVLAIPIVGLFGNVMQWGKNNSFPQEGQRARVVVVDARGRPIPTRTAAERAADNEVHVLPSTSETIEGKSYRELEPGEAITQNMILILKPTEHNPNDIVLFVTGVDGDTITGMLMGPDGQGGFSSKPGSVQRSDVLGVVTGSF